MLLLWSVRLIRTGVERAFMPQLKRSLKNLSDNRLSAAAGGMLAAMVLQSSTAVALVGSGFAISGLLGTTAALALLLGADLGSALMAQVLFLPVQALVPFALIAGVGNFFKARGRKAKQIGRILIGFALVLVSLSMIRTATAPISGNEIVQSIAAYFQTDLLSAYVFGALLAWAMHSSLAAVLVFATFAATGLIAAPVAAALVIGANLGGALVPVVLLWSGDRPGQLIALGNLFARGGTTLVFIAILMSGPLPSTWLAVLTGQQAIALHILVNVAVVVFALPFATALIAAAERVAPAKNIAGGDTLSALDQSALDHTPLALACTQRELLRMAETVQSMLVPVMQLFRAWDGETARVIAIREDHVDRMHFETKIYVSKLRESALDSIAEKATLDVIAIANSFEEAADRIAVNLTALAKKMRDEAMVFSDEGLSDLAVFHDQVATNGQLALRVLTTGDAEAARQLVEEKDRIRIEEQRLQERHLKRLQEGGPASIETTNIHQEVLRLLKQINAAISYVAYPIAEETGDLLESRLARPRRIVGLP
ncbi:MAG: Na/Pi cotransporter family protein [Pseudomonadota bacterium]